MTCERCHRAPAVVAVVEPGRIPAAAELCESCRRSWEDRKRDLLSAPKVSFTWNVTFSTSG